MWKSEDISPTETEEERRAKARESLRIQREQQGVQPLDVDALPSVWPEDENIDEFIATIRAWRKGEEAL